jgi:Na+-driven multidrug efflux pump
VGIPSSLSQMSGSIGMIFVNMILAGFGATVIAAFGLYVRMESVFILPVIGISMGLVTMLGLFMGSKQYKKLIGIFNYTNKMSFIMTSMAALLFIFTAGNLMSIFTDSSEVIAIGTGAAYFMAPAIPFFAIYLISSSAFQGIGRAMPALYLSFLRIGIIIPLAYMLSLVANLGATGIWVTYAISESSTGIIGYIWFRSQSFGKNQ